MGVVGVAGIGVAIFDRYKEIPYTQVENVGTDQTVQANGGAKGT